MKILFLVVFLFLTACDEKYEFFKCTVRVDLKWDSSLTYKQRNNVLEKFANLNAMSGDEVFGMTLNSHDTIIHFYVGDRDYKCPSKFEKNKYKDVEKVLNKYLQPIKNSPQYTIYKKPLLENEFEGLKLYENKY